jgi:type IV secretion system protein TrbG
MKLKLFLRLIPVAIIYCCCTNVFALNTTTTNNNSSSSSNNAQNIVPQNSTAIINTNNLSNKTTRNLVGKAAVAAANRKALRHPNAKEYFNSIMTFNYLPGALYKIYAAPLSITDIQFQPNEHIISIAAGDTVRWQVSKTYSGSGAGRQEHILIKPVEEELDNGLVVTTDQRTYHLMMHSTPKTYMASVTWRYPGSEDLVENFSDEISSDTNNILDLNRLNFNYAVKLIKGKKPNWCPMMIFNNGSKTYIKFPASMQEAPTLFAGNNPKENQIINYRISGNYYVIDSVFSAAELRDSQTIIQIKFQG